MVVVTEMEMVANEPDSLVMAQWMWWNWMLVLVVSMRAPLERVRTAATLAQVLWCHRPTERATPAPLGVVLQPRLAFQPGTWETESGRAQVPIPLGHGPLVKCLATRRPSSSTAAPSLAPRGLA